MTTPTTRSAIPVHQRLRLRKALQRRYDQLLTAEQCEKLALALEDRAAVSFDMYGRVKILSPLAVDELAPLLRKPHAAEQADIKAEMANVIEGGTPVGATPLPTRINSAEDRERLLREAL